MFIVNFIIENDSVMYFANSTCFIIIVKIGDKFELTTADNYVYTYDSIDEAIEQAKAKITRFLASLGVNEVKFISK